MEDSCPPSDPPLSQAGQAHAAVEARAATGKVVLVHRVEGWSHGTTEQVLADFPARAIRLVAQARAEYDTD